MLGAVLQMRHLVVLVEHSAAAPARRMLLELLEVELLQMRPLVVLEVRLFVVRPQKQLLLVAELLEVALQMHFVAPGEVHFVVHRQEKLPDE